MTTTDPDSPPASSTVWRSTRCLDGPVQAKPGDRLPSAGLLTPVQARIDQVRANLERLRWVAHELGGEHLRVRHALQARPHADEAALGPPGVPRHTVIVNVETRQHRGVGRQRGCVPEG